MCLSQVTLFPVINIYKGKVFVLKTHLACTTDNHLEGVEHRDECVIIISNSSNVLRRTTAD